MALVPGSMVPRLRFTDGDIAEMTHPFVGHAATASGTPPEKRSAKMILERFCMLTEPLASVICEVASPAPENLGTTFTGPTRPTIAAVGPEALAEPAEVAGLVALVVGGVVAVVVALGISVFVITADVPGTDSDETPMLTLANAEAGSPPRVCAFSACRA